jgi:hypothetical protein
MFAELILEDAADPRCGCDDATNVLVDVGCDLSDSRGWTVAVRMESARVGEMRPSIRRSHCDPAAEPALSVRPDHESVEDDTLRARGGVFDS